MKRTYTDDFGDTLIIEQQGESIFVSINNKDGPVAEACVQLTAAKADLVTCALFEAQRRAQKARGRR